jgi:hypothetical protein
MFHGTNRLVVPKRNRDSVKDTEVEIEYRFDDAEGLQVFLQEVRGMDLVDIFHFEQITSDRSALYGESRNEALHIWRTRDMNATGSLTFFANGEERRILDFPVSLFEASVVRHKSKRAVKINFIQQTPIMQEKKHWLRRKFSRSSPRSSSRMRDPLMHPSMRHNADWQQRTSCLKEALDRPPICNWLWRELIQVEPRVLPAQTRSL